MYRTTLCFYGPLKVYIKYEPLFRKIPYLCENISRLTFLSNSATAQKVCNNLDIKHELDKVEYKLQPLQNLLQNIHLAHISNEEAERILTMCGNNMVDASNTSRNEICQRVYKTLLEHGKVDMNILQAYINICTENDVKLNFKEVLTNTKCKLTEGTYKLMLKNVSERGDIEEAIRILDMMKLDSVPIDEYVFNNLVLAHAIAGGLAAAELVLNTMRAAQLNESNDTRFSILRGILRRSNFNEFQISLQKYGFKLDVYQLLDIITELGLNNIKWLSSIETLYNESIVSKEFGGLLKQRCIYLVHMHKSDAAIAIFKKFFSKSTQQENYGFFILEEMLHCNYDSKTIMLSVKVLQEMECEEYMLKQLLGISLRIGKTEMSWILLQNLSELRPHYFWPLLIDASIKGETGVLEAVLKMKKLNVQCDFESWTDYIFPYCNLDNCKFLITKLQNHGFTVKDILSPLLSVLIKNKKLTAALDLCGAYNIKIFGEDFLKFIPMAWFSTRDSVTTVSLLQKYCESNENRRDFVGEVLISILKLCKKPSDFHDYSAFVKVIHERSLNILPASAASIQVILKTNDYSMQEVKKIEDQINAILDFRLKPDAPYIPHPNDMSLEELECHLLELQEKQMKTRGVLRKLIQLYSNMGNIERVKELRELFLTSEYEESIGMKSSIFHTFIKGKDVKDALDIYKEIRKTNSTFILDDYKVIDFCAILVHNDQISEAWSIIEEEAKLKKEHFLRFRKDFRKEGIKRNCLELLNAFKNEDQQFKMFTFLVNNKYCDPENVLLGSLVRIHLTKGNIEKACENYIDFVQKYKCTPLQFELIKELLTRKNEDLLEKILKYTAQIHGHASTQAALIAATAETGNVAALLKLLSKNEIPVHRYLKQKCDRWVKEGKSDALMTLLSAYSRERKSLYDVSYVIKALMELFRYNDDVKAVSKLYDYLVDNEIQTSELDVVHRLKQQMQQNSK